MEGEGVSPTRVRALCGRRHPVVEHHARSELRNRILRRCALNLDEIALLELVPAGKEGRASAAVRRSSASVQTKQGGGESAARAWAQQFCSGSCLSWSARPGLRCRGQGGPLGTRPARARALQERLRGAAVPSAQAAAAAKEEGLRDFRACECGAAGLCPVRKLAHDIEGLVQEDHPRGPPVAFPGGGAARALLPPGRLRRRLRRPGLAAASRGGSWGGAAANRREGESGAVFVVNERQRGGGRSEGRRGEGQSPVAAVHCASISRGETRGIVRAARRQSRCSHQKAFPREDRGMSELGLQQHAPSTHRSL